MHEGICVRCACITESASAAYSASVLVYIPSELSPFDVWIAMICNCAVFSINICNNFSSGIMLSLISFARACNLAIVIL